MSNTVNVKTDSYEELNQSIYDELIKKVYLDKFKDLSKKLSSQEERSGIIEGVVLSPLRVIHDGFNFLTFFRKVDEVIKSNYNDIKEFIKKSEDKGINKEIIKIYLDFERLFNEVGREINNSYGLFLTNKDSNKRKKEEELYAKENEKELEKLEEMFDEI